MPSYKRVAAGASALALASGAILTGAGIAGAQGSSEIAAGLGLAASALNGPVTVAGNAAGGPTVTYTNGAGAGEKCVGAVMPYTSALKAGLDLSGDKPPADLITKTRAIQEMGGVSVLNAQFGGSPVAYEAGEFDGIPEAIPMLINGRGGMGVGAGATVEWTAPSPEAPAIAAIFCIPDSVTEPEDRAEAIALHIGIDPRAVVDQLNGILPGSSIAEGSISGGSLESGATLLGSLGS